MTERWTAKVRELGTPLPSGPWATARPRQHTRIDELREPEARPAHLIAVWPGARRVGLLPLGASRATAWRYVSATDSSCPARRNWLIGRQRCAPPLPFSPALNERYAGDRRSPSPPGRIPLDTRVIIAHFPARYAEMITVVSLDLCVLVKQVRGAAGLGQGPAPGRGTGCTQRIRPGLGPPRARAADRAAAGHTTP